MGTLLSALHLPTPTSFSAMMIGRFALANAETSARYWPASIIRRLVSCN